MESSYSLTTENDLHPLYAVWCPRIRKFVIFADNKRTQRVEQYIYNSDGGSFEQIHRPDIEYNPKKPRSEANVMLTVKASKSAGVTVVMRDAETKCFRKEQFCMVQHCFVTLPPAPVKTLQRCAQTEMIEAILAYNLRQAKKELEMVVAPVAPKPPKRDGDIHDQQFFDIDNELVVDYKSAVTYRQLSHIVKKCYLEWLESLGVIGNNWVEEEMVKIKEEVNAPPTMESEEVLLDHFSRMSTSLKKATLVKLQTHLKVFWIDVEALDMPIVNKMKKMLAEHGVRVDLKRALKEVEDVVVVDKRRTFERDFEGMQKAIEQIKLREAAEDSDESDDSFTDCSPSENDSDFEMV